MYTSSNDNISLPEIERFELEAKKTYELNSFKIEYKFLGEKKDITLDDVNSAAIILYGNIHSIYRNLSIINAYDGIRESPDIIASWGCSFENAYGMAIHALEKQIPKKVKNSGERIPFEWYCPTCGELLCDDGYKDTNIKYCDQCGQALDCENT